MYLKPQPLVNNRINRSIAFLLFLFTLTTYTLTMARSLSFWDAGEYITCSSILGIPHPPGNPFYILIGRFLTIIGANIPHAQVVNFLSALFSALAVMFTYLFTVKLITMIITSRKESYKAYLGGLIAATFTAFSYTFWTNAIEAEVYSGLVFIINLIVWLTMLWLEKSENLSHQNILLLIIYIFFLGFGIHQTSLQIAPAVLFIAVYPFLKENVKTAKFWTRLLIYIVALMIIYGIFLQLGKAIDIPSLSKYMFALGLLLLLYYHFRDKVPGKAWLLALLFIFIGLSTHYYLMVRSAHRPFINEGHPHNWKLFTDYVLRRQYGTTSMFVRRASLWYQMKIHFLDYFSWQFFNAETISRWFRIPAYFIQSVSNILVTFLGALGAYFQLKKNKHSFAYMFALFFMVSIAMIFVMNLSDSEVRERDYFFVTAYNFWAVWMAFGSLALLDIFHKSKKAVYYTMIALIILLPVFNMVSQYHVHDRSREYIALGYGYNILKSVDKNSIVFTNGDNDTFPVWYAQAVDDPATEKFSEPEQEKILARYEAQSADNVHPTAKTITLLEKALNYKNEQCHGIRKDVTVANLSLLNTPWYIKQLRDFEGVEFSIPDKHIDLCQDSPASALYPRQIAEDRELIIKGQVPGDEIKVTFKKGTILYVKDLAVLQIIKENYGKRPIYFAVTTPDVVGFESYLQNEGMVDRLVPTDDPDQVDIERLIANIDSVYSYRGVFDDTIYKDKNMKRLLNNYGAAYMRASRYYHNNDNYGLAIQYMEKALEFVEQKQRFYYGLAQLYIEAGYFLIENSRIEEGFTYLENAVYYNRHDPAMIQIIFQAADYAAAPLQGIELLRKIKPYQDSLMINSYIEELQQSIPEK